MRNGETHRRALAWLLLAVFVPMLLTASLHRHDYGGGGEGVCYECLHHLRHAGHIHAFGVSTSDCVLCQFLSLTFIAAATVALIVPGFRLRTMLRRDAASVPAPVAGRILPRAPPFLSESL